MSQPSFSGVNRVRAWDRAEQRSVEVWASDWESARPYTTVQVFDNFTRTGSYWARKADLDFRYFGEPFDATPEVRAQWARRAAYDRREFWRDVHSTPVRRLERERDMHRLEGAAWFVRVADNELARRAAGRQVNDRGHAILFADYAQIARQRAANSSREAQRAWEAADLAVTQEKRASR
jgi:hypothetical protein